MPEPVTLTKDEVNAIAATTGDNQCRVYRLCESHEALRKLLREAVNPKHARTLLEQHWGSMADDFARRVLAALGEHE